MCWRHLFGDCAPRRISDRCRAGRAHRRGDRPRARTADRLVRSIRQLARRGLARRHWLMNPFFANSGPHLRHPDVIEERLGGFLIERPGGDRGLIDRDLLQLGRQRADQLYTLDRQDLGDLMQPELDLALADRLDDVAAGKVPVVFDLRSGRRCRAFEIPRARCLPLVPIAGSIMHDRLGGEQGRLERCGGRDVGRVRTVVTATPTPTRPTSVIDARQRSLSPTACFIASADSTATSGPAVSPRDASSARPSARNPRRLACRWRH